MQVVEACLTCVEPDRSKASDLRLVDLVELPDKAGPSRCSQVKKTFWMSLVLQSLHMAWGTHLLIRELQAALPHEPSDQVRTCALSITASNII